MSDDVDTSTSRPPPRHPSDAADALEPEAVAAQAPSPQQGWGPARVLGGLAFLIALVIVEAGIVYAADPQIESLAARLVLQGLLAASLIVTAFLFASDDLRSLASPALLGWRLPGRSWIGPMAIAYFGYVGCAIVIAALLQPHQEDVTRDLGFGESTLGSVAAGVLIVGIAPLSEEIFFRGFIFGGLSRAMPVALAAVISSAVWGLFHYTDPDSWGVVLQLSLFGLTLAWLYRRTGSIWPTIGVHAINNAIAFALLTS